MSRYKLLKTNKQEEFLDAVGNITIDINECKSFPKKICEYDIANSTYCIYDKETESIYDLQQVAADFITEENYSSFIAIPKTLSTLSAGIYNIENVGLGYQFFNSEQTIYEDFEESLKDLLFNATYRGAVFFKLLKHKNTCNWFKYDYRTIAPKYHDANNPYWRLPEDMDKLKYCPYCGKEIIISN